MPSILCEGMRHETPNSGDNLSRGYQTLRNPHSKRAAEEVGHEGWVDVHQVLNSPGVGCVVSALMLHACLVFVGGCWVVIADCDNCQMLRF